MNDNLQSELKGQNQLIELMKTQLKSLETVPPPSIDERARNRQQRLKVIMDSNRKVVCEPLQNALPDHDIEYVQTCYSTSDLKNYMEEMKQNGDDETLVVMMGTNDIIKNRDRKAAKNIRALRKAVPKNTYFVHIPPQKASNIKDLDNMADNSRRGLNDIYDKYFETIQIPEIEANPDRYLERDGYHLNNEAGAYISSEIKKHLHKKTTTTLRNDVPTRTIVQDTQHTTSVIIPKEMMKHIIGTNWHIIIKKINENNSTTTRNKEAGPVQTTIEITGTKEATEETKKDIEEQLKKRERDAEMKQMYGKKQCRFMDKCRYRDLCWYSHNPQQTEPKTILKKSTTERNVRYEGEKEDRHRTGHNRSRSMHRTERDMSWERSERRRPHVERRERETGRERYQAYNERDQDFHARTRSRFRSVHRPNREDNRTSPSRGYSHRREYYGTPRHHRN